MLLPLLTSSPLVFYCRLLAGRVPGGRAEADTLDQARRTAQGSMWRGPDECLAILPRVIRSWTPELGVSCNHPRRRSSRQFLNLAGLAGWGCSGVLTLGALEVVGRWPWVPNGKSEVT